MPTFKDFMESALYDPEAGFYPNREAKEDFYTAPELHPAFAGVLTRQIVARLSELKGRAIPEPYCIVEMGSGSGLLARQIIGELRRNHPDWSQKVRYVLVERSRNLLLDSVTALSALNGRVLGYSRIEDLPPCSGVFFSNELVDAFPVHLLERNAGKVREVYVDGEGKTHAGELSTSELKAHANALSEALDGERHAVNLEALRWIAAVSRRIKAGYLMTIDYGARYRPGTCNPPRTFFRHATDGDLTQPGRDLTANVDFEALIGEGQKQGLSLQTYSTLGRFLIEGGIEDWFAKTGEGALGAKSRSQMKTLIHPEGMGEVFKVLVQSKLP